MRTPYMYIKKKYSLPYKTYSKRNAKEANINNHKKTIKKHTPFLIQPIQSAPQKSIQMQTLTTIFKEKSYTLPYKNYSKAKEKTSSKAKEHPMGKTKQHPYKTYSKKKNTPRKHIQRREKT